MNDVGTRRQVGTKTFPSAVAALDHTPPPPAPNGRRISVRRKFSELLEYFNPFAANHTSPPPQDEDIPAAKKPRLEASTSFSTAEDEETFFDADTYFYAETADSVTTAPTDDIVAVAPKDAVTAASLTVVNRDIATVLPPLQSTEAPGSPRVRRKWTVEEDAKLIDAVKKCGKDWLAVAALVPGRKNRMCRQRWADNLDPDALRTMGQWTAEEDAMLYEGMQKHWKDYVAVAALVPGRNNKDCRHRWADKFEPKKNRKMGKWTAKEDAKLKKAVKKYHGKDWVAVAALVPGRSNVQCRERWAYCLDPNTHRQMGKWAAEEDAKLIDAATKYGNDWVAVAALVPGRSNVQCCHRWTDGLDPCTSRKNGKWREEEDAKLIEGVQRHGKDWVAVATLVPNRNNEQCAKRWGIYLNPDINWTKGADGKMKKTQS
jgi:hypothetical protein